MAAFRIDPAHETPQLAATREKFTKLIAGVFKKQREKAAAKIRAAAKLHKAGADDWETFSNSIYNLISDDFLDIPEPAAEALGEAAGVGVSKGALELQISNANLISKINQIAADWADDRGAELVGMRFAEDGSLIENPNAQWRITDYTRDALRNIIKQGFEDEITMTDLSQQILDAGAFSESRAEMIARTEVARAQVRGNLETWKESGVVETVQWLLSEDHEIEDECDDNDGEIVGIGEDFPSGDDAPPLHPNCWCALVSVDITSTTSDDTGDEDEADTEAA